MADLKASLGDGYNKIELSYYGSYSGGIDPLLHMEIGSESESQRRINLDGAQARMLGEFLITYAQKVKRDLGGWSG